MNVMNILVLMTILFLLLQIKKLIHWMFWTTVCQSMEILIKFREGHVVISCRGHQESLPILRLVCHQLQEGLCNLRHTGTQGFTRTVSYKVIVMHFNTGE